jgi:hypothetical protein
MTKKQGRIYFLWYFPSETVTTPIAFLYYLATFSEGFAARTLLVSVYPSSMSRVTQNILFCENNFVCKNYYTEKQQEWSRDVSVSLATSLRAGRLKIRVSIPQKGKRYVSSQNLPDGLSKLTSL